MLILVTNLFRFILQKLTSTDVADGQSSRRKEILFFMEVCADSVSTVVNFHHKIVTTAT